MTSAREKTLEKKIEKLEAEKASWACGHKAYRVCGKCADKLEKNLAEAIEVIKLFTARPTYKRQQCTSSISWKTMNISTPDLEKAWEFLKKMEGI